MRTKATTVGAVLIALGVVALVGPTFGFATVNSDRTVGVSTADPSAALLAIEQDGVTVTDQNEPASVLTLTNNVHEALTLDIDVELGSGLAEADGFATDLSSGAETTYDVTCEPGSGAGETILDVTVRSAAGETVTINGVNVSYAIERDCPGTPPGSGNEIFEIRQEHWNDDREYIFEIVDDGVWDVDWEFGDGTTGTGHYIEHTYDEDGTYEVTLTATVDGEEQTFTETLIVTDDSEDGGEKPPAEDVYDVRQEDWLDDREYVFEIVSDDVWNANWEFGDGTVGSDHHVRHTYDEDGAYELTLVATIDGRQYTYTETVDVTG